MGRRSRAVVSALAAIALVVAFTLASGAPAAALHARLQGTVTDRASGAPLADVCVTLGPPIRCWTSTNANGLYSIDLRGFGPDGQAWQVYYLRTGYVTTDRTYTLSGETTGNVALDRDGGPPPPATTPVPNLVQTPIPVAMPPPAPGAPAPAPPPAAPSPGATLPPPGGVVAPAPTPAPVVSVEQRIADFWKRIDALLPTDNVSAGDLGGWALNVIERQPRARLTATDFRASTAGMQAGLDRAGLGPVPAVAPTPVPDIEQRIADFWTRIDALAPGDFVSAADLGQWALNVIGRIPRAQLSVTDFRASTAAMQDGLDRAGLAP